MKCQKIIDPPKSFKNLFKSCTFYYLNKSEASLQHGGLKLKNRITEINNYRRETRSYRNSRNNLRCKR